MLDLESMTSDGGNDVFVLPATPNQTRFWSLDQLHPGNAALNMPLAWSCRGELHPELVSAALSELIVRHESLRTTFDLVEGGLSQIVQPAFKVPLPIEDLTHLRLEARKGRAESITRREARMRMDMKKGPLFFARLIRMDLEEHILLITMHHSICDGWSNGVLLRDFASTYDALVRHGEPELPNLDIQFGDFAIWLEEWRKSAEASESLEYWRKTLGRDFTPLRIKHDPPAVKSEAQGDIETLLLSPKLVQQARDFCAAEGFTTYMLLLSVYAIALSRLTGLSDILIGSPCANRRPGTENLIGAFSNPQVLRAKFDRSDTFRSILDRVRTWTLGAISNQDLPFEDLIEDPFFLGERNQINLQLYFVYQRAFMQDQHGSALDIVPIRSVSPGTSFELMLSIVERAEGPRLQLEYNPEFFQVSTIQRILRLYNRILEAGLADAGRSVDELEIIEENERWLVVEEWNRTEVDFGAFEPVHKLVERRASEQPDAKALAFKGVTWTYRQLNEYGNQLARYLRNMDLGADSLVAVCLERSCESVGAILGVLKSGAAYLPIDPTDPPLRIDQILADAKADALFTKKSLAAQLHAESRAILVESDENLWARESTATLEASSNADPTPDSLAYVIYGSGSKGKPQGIAVEHGALTNLLRSLEREPGLSPTDTLVSVTPFCFDTSVVELFLPLAAGASVTVASTEEIRDGQQLLTLIGDSGATVLHATPEVWRALIEAGWRGQPQLKVLCSGDTLPRDLADTLREVSTEVWNLYGTSETAVWSSATRVGPGAARVGPPIANTQFYVLDERLKPVPVGVMGELFIGGLGLARGYWHQPELTSERFLPSPFGAGRMYRTGDMARWSADGHIDLLGRLDFQVKVKGHRVEPGEIEEGLASSPEVREAVVVAMNDESGHKRMAAWVESAMAEPPSDLSARLHATLAGRLPDYLLPVTITVVPSLPRTASGKVDRKNLPTPDFATQLSHRFVKPRDDVEKKLLEIWKSVLGLQKISVEANFFELGGNSLMILRLIARVNTAFQSLLPIPIIYTAPTIEKMAAVLGRNEEKDFVLALQPNGWRPPLFMIQSYHLYRTLPAALGGDQPFYGVRELELEDRAFPYTLQDLVKTYVRHIREVQPNGPYYLGGFCFFALLAFAVASELEQQGQEVAFLGLIDANCPYYWRKQAKSEGSQKRFATVIRYHARQLRKLSATAAIAYMGRFASRKLWNQILNISQSVRHRAYGYFMRRKMQLPRLLRNKTMVTRVAARMHRPQPIHANVHLFPAADQPYPDDVDTALGWGEMTSGQVKTIWLPGSHEDMFLESNIDVMAQKLRQAISEVMLASATTPNGAAS